MSWAIWITGPPGSGKTTLARSATTALRARGICVALLEFDEIRKVLTPAPADTDQEREVVHRALAYMATLLTRARVPVIIDAAGHRRAWRELARTLIPAFAEVQLRCPVEILRQREQARAGARTDAEQRGMTRPGEDLPYEETAEPELFIETHTRAVGVAVQEVLYIVRRLARTAHWLDRRRWPALCE